MRLRDWRQHPQVLALEDSLLGRLVTALFRINLRDRALSLAGQAFMALVPMVIVLATLLTSTDAQAVGDWLIAEYHLTGTAEQAVTSLFSRPPDATSGVGVVGFLVLLMSVNSFARLVQRTYELAWELPPRRGGRTLDGIKGALALLLILGGMAFVSGALNDLIDRPLVVQVLKVLVAVPAWWGMTHLFLGGRVSWTLLLPGAVVAAVGHVLTSLGSSLWMPYLIERNAERYGVIGVAVALISWLLVLAFLVVTSAVVQAQIGPALTPNGGGTRTTHGGLLESTDTTDAFAEAPRPRPSR
jgi:membrane protein